MDLTFEEQQNTPNEREYSAFFSLYAFLTVYVFSKMSYDEKLNFPGVKGTLEIIEKLQSGNLSIQDFNIPLISTALTAAYFAYNCHDNYTIECENDFTCALTAMGVPNELQSTNSSI